MPILLRDEVPDPDPSKRTPSVLMLTTWLKRLQGLVCTLHSDDPRPHVCFERSDLRLKQIFTLTRLSSNSVKSMNGGKSWGVSSTAGSIPNTLS